jgi:predicted AAA+ superfamily ATPase
MHSNQHRFLLLKYFQNAQSEKYHLMILMSSNPIVCSEMSDKLTGKISDSKMFSTKKQKLKWIQNCNH